MDEKKISINSTESRWIDNNQIKANVRRCECSFRHNRKEHRCYILEDDDEAIAMAGPHTRLIDAIKQDCSYEHLWYLINEYNIDISLSPKQFNMEVTMRSGGQRSI